MKIRTATTADMDVICRLYDTLFQEMADLQADYFQMTSQNRDFLSSIIEEEKGMSCWRKRRIGSSVLPWCSKAARRLLAVSCHTDTPT